VRGPVSGYHHYPKLLHQDAGAKLATKYGYSLRTMITLLHATKSDGGQWSDDDYVVFDGAQCIGHIMRTHQAPQRKPWFWTIFARKPQAMHDRGYAATREQAMAEVEASWIGR